MRWRRLLLALLALAAAVHVAAAAPAGACSCTSGPSGDQQYVGWADAVFVAEFVSYSPPPQRATMSSMDPAVWTFAVSAVYKGEVAAQQDVVSASNGASCGLELPHAGRFLLFASTSGDPATTVDGPVLYSHLCAGNRALGDAEVPALLEKPKPPLPGVRAAVLPPTSSPSMSPSSMSPSSMSPSSVSPSVEAAVTARRSGPGSGVDWATVAVGVTGGVAVALTAAMLLPRRRRSPGR
ncbi:MAG: hypothetical protein ABIM89_17930 [Mycobacteriales bacterium]